VRAREKMPQQDELRSLFDDVVRSIYLRRSLSLSALFKYLWAKRNEPSQSLDIWEEALHEFSQSEDRDRPKDQYDYQSSVRERCLELRKALQDYNANSGQEWRVMLPNAIPRRGYQLEVMKIDDSLSPTFSFWQTHAKANRDVCVVYVEQLFYQSWRNRSVFRYYDCNEDHPGLALAELKQRHPEAYTDELNVAYPFVACGEIEARDAIADWFSEHSMVKVKGAVTRRRNDKEIWRDSLILLGGSPGNRMIKEVLESCPRLDICLKESWDNIDGRPSGVVLVKNASEDEIGRFARFNPVRTASDCALHFSPEQGSVLAIVTRVPNPYANSAVTIINTDFGRAVEQVAQLLIDEERMGGKEWPELWDSIPGSFQVLYAIPIRSLSADYLLAKELEPLAWRSYGA
jgi:hypothetical protein